MNVIPFPRRPEPEPLAFAIGARVDLRVGALAAGVVRPRGILEDVFAFSNLTRLIRGARMAWRERGQHSGLVLSVPRDIQTRLEAEFLSDAANEAGCTRQSFTFELDERQIVAAGPALAEQLRERGWGVALRSDPDCPLPFGARARAIYTEIVIDAPEDANPFMALDDADRSPLGRRLLAAKAAGLIITAETVRTAAQARILAIAGFDRGGGPFAEAGLR
ncbi:MAG: hypothetical protein ABL864_10875 [Terricaulis sp.]|jgi:hypothetical protein